jgi:CheY-like chemotaxis protein
LPGVCLREPANSVNRTGLPISCSMKSSEDRGVGGALEPSRPIGPRQGCRPTAPLYSPAPPRNGQAVALLSAHGSVLSLYHLRETLPWPSAGRSNAVEMKVDRTLVHVVDDNATFRKTIEGCLEQFGYAVSTYPSAQHLLDRLPNDAAPSCILLDVRMPLMSGPELQERLGELGSTLPIIFVTGHPDVRTTVRTIKAGGEDFLIKPVTSEQLLEAVQRIVQSQCGA